jgi:hypothetical protein
MTLNVGQICLPEKVTMILCIIIKCNLQVTTCSWTPYFKITFPVHILRNGLLWPHFTLSYEFFYPYLETQHSFKKCPDLRSTGHWILISQCNLNRPTLFRLHNTKIWSIISENLWIFTAKVYLYVVSNCIKFPIVLIIFTPGHINSSRNCSEWNSKLSDSKEFLSFYRNLKRYNIFYSLNSTYL